MSELSHIDEQGRVAMVDTSAKEATARRALASARVRTTMTPSEGGGSAISSSAAELALPGNTVIARILFLGSLPALADNPGGIDQCPRQQEKGKNFPALEATKSGVRVLWCFDKIPGDEFIEGHGADRSQAVGDRGGLYSLGKLVFRPRARFPRDRVHPQCRGPRGPWRRRSSPDGRALRTPHRRRTPR